MDALLESIRTALVPEASADAREAGANACRTILTALEAKPAEPMPATVVEPAQIAALITTMRGMPPDQLLELAIAKLRSMFPDEANVPRAAPMRLQFVPVPGGKP
jgi:hypothetical protein